MAAIFETSTVGTLVLANRAVRSATWEGGADNRGHVTDKILELYAGLAEGGIGLIITGFQYVLPNGIGIAYQTGNYSDDLLPGLMRLCETARTGGARVLAQLVHTGSKADPGLFTEEGEIWGPSAVPDPLTGRVPKEMTRQEITLLVEAYAAAARRAQRAGFDGVQLHGAHGYGINQFLSAFANRRSDCYGGGTAGRYRFLGEVLEAIRGTVGNDYPLFIKLSGDDFYPGGLGPEEAIEIGRRLVEDGIACIEVSGGSKASPEGMVPSRTNVRREDDEAYLANLAARFRERLSIPIVTVGGIRSPAVAGKVLARGLADYVAFCRPLIREPRLIRRWQEGDLEKARCVSCNGCYATGLAGLGISCELERDGNNP
ncbi:MAG TPA: NADH:flavin oxidoreductase [Geobacteraceae bacterium]|nr:NADH:flavin oxidoreductase [Geobacteraceae bacterium]